jgi:hypothetical protein
LLLPLSPPEFVYTGVIPASAAALGFGLFESVASCFSSTSRVILHYPGQLIIYLLLLKTTSSPPLTLTVI